MIHRLIIALLIVVSALGTRFVYARQTPPVNFDFSATARSLLIKSRRACENGRIREARRFWLKARALNNRLATPSWLLRYRAATSYAQPLPASLSGALKFATNSRSLTRKALEARVFRVPGDLEARRRLLEIARAEHDTKAVRRHASALGEPIDPWLPTWVKPLLSLLGGSLVIWQALRLYQDVKKTDPPNRLN